MPADWLAPFFDAPTSRNYPADKNKGERKNLVIPCPNRKGLAVMGDEDLVRLGAAPESMTILPTLIRTGLFRPDHKK